MKIKILLLLLTFTQIIFAEQKFTLSGYIKDSQTGETLIGANIFDKNNRGMGTASNIYGFYSITLPSGEHTFVVSFIGYKSIEQTITLKENTNIDFVLNPEGITQQEVVISATRQDNVQSTDMGKVSMSIENIKSLPALFGEVDIMRSLQLLPGIRSAGEINAGFYVRGGGPDQNLVLLDEAVVYNTGHLFGFFSVFNSDAIKNVTLHKGSMPAEYGGRLSSVIDVQMKEGNNQKFQGEGGIGIISSRLTLQGPIQKNKSSFIIAGRRTYADLLAKPFLNNTDYEGNGYYFYDLNLKANYIFSPSDRLFLSAYFGRDVFSYRSKDNFTLKMPWGNSTATLRWNHLFSDKIFMNVSAIYNSYDFDISSKFNDFSFKLFSGVADWNLKTDFNFFPSPRHTLKAGINYTNHTFTPYSVNAVIDTTEIKSDSYNQKHAHDISAYVQDDWSISTNVRLNVGVRASMFSQVGPYRYPVFDENNIIRDTIFYPKGKVIQTYYGIEPRINARFTINQSSSIKAGVTFSNQYIHLVSVSGSTLPYDLWIPSSKRIKPQLGIQYSVGYFKNFKDDTYEASAEVYYKTLNNQIEYSEKSVPEINGDPEVSLTFGKGKSYGIELFVKKRTGKFNGWIGYTLSKTDKTFPDINNGKTFPAKYDRRHDLSVVACYDVSKRWKLSSTFVYGTGEATTLPNSFYLISGWLYSEYMPRNSYRLKPYHRMDVSSTWVLSKPGSKLYNELNLSIYNVYSRLNPFFIYTSVEIPKSDEQNTGATAYVTPIDIKLKQVSIFPIVPSLTWNFKF